MNIKELIQESFNDVYHVRQLSPNIYQFETDNGNIYNIDISGGGISVAMLDSIADTIDVNVTGEIVYESYMDVSFHLLDDEGKYHTKYSPQFIDAKPATPESPMKIFATVMAVANRMLSARPGVILFQGAGKLGDTYERMLKRLAPNGYSVFSYMGRYLMPSGHGSTDIGNKHFVMIRNDLIETSTSHSSTFNESLELFNTIRMVTEGKVEKGTYSGVRFNKQTVEDIQNYIKLSDIPNGVPADKLHSTILYSRKHLPDYVPAGEYEEPIIGKPLELDVWETQPDEEGNTKNCLVLKYECEGLCARHMALMDAHGATFDYDEYTPHVTLSYDIGDMDKSSLPDIKKFVKEIVIEKEYMEELTLDWAKSLK